MSLSFEDCIRLLGRLPQAGVIRPEDAARWVRLTMRTDPKRIRWHIARAGGIGGSEAGTVASWAFGDFPARESAARLALRKLLVIPPDRPNDDTARGSYLENDIRRRYEEKLTEQGRSWRRLEAEKRQVEAGPHPVYSWMRASLDGLYEIDGRTVIVDFKAPSEASLEEYLRTGHWDEYACQLNHYAVVAAGRGITADRLDLAFYDYRRVATVGVQVVPVENSPELQARLVRASASFWNDWVMRGQVPEDERRRVLAADVPEPIERMARQAVVCKIASDRLKADFEEAREAVTAWVRRTGRLGDGVLPLGSFAEGAPGFLECRASESLDVDAAAARLIDLGMSAADLEDLRGPDRYDPRKIAPAFDRMLRLMRRAATEILAGRGGTELAEEILAEAAAAPVKEKGGYDPERVKTALESFGECPYNFVAEEIAANLPRGKAMDLQERKAMVGEAAARLTENLVACESATKIPCAESPAPPAP